MYRPRYDPPRHVPRDQLLLLALMAMAIGLLFFGVAVMSTR